ncbi:MAG: putative manganese transporter [Pseudomonadota bacterium]|nr:putative manganese transporter [Pseudomonadota bacterium]
MIIGVLKHALMITSFVLIMMLLIEYINVQTRGVWQRTLRKSRAGQIVLGATLGAIPGCLGAFTVVSLYSHRAVSFGALVAAMVATSGDESFVMFSMVPVQALWLTAILFLVALAAGWLTDRLFTRQDRFLEREDHELELHQKEVCHCFSRSGIVQQLKEVTFPRALLIAMFGGFLFLLTTGLLGPPIWDWKKITFAAGTAFALFVVLTVPDHFLEEHLWEHVLKRHLLRIFLWTFGVLLVIHSLDAYIDIQTWVQENLFLVLIIAILVGIIPESGPHLVFVTLFADGAIPFAILLANSIVQDGHGTLPLLAVSQRAFLWLKLVNIGFGLLLGIVGLYLLP